MNLQMNTEQHKHYVHVCIHANTHIERKRKRERKSYTKEVGGLSFVILTKKKEKNHNIEKCYGGNVITTSVL